MDIGELRALVVIAETGTVTAAAERLFVSQPALSERVKRLERALGATLFVRDGRGMRLTPAGEAYLPHAQRVLDELERGQEAVRSSRRARRLLRVDVHDPALAVPRRLLGRLRAELPEADVEVSGSGTLEQVSRLRDGRLDLALCIACPAPAGIVQIPWETESLAVALPADHALAGAAAVPLTALADEVHYLPRESFAPEWNARIRGLVGSPLREIGIRGDTTDAPLALVAAGECVAVSLASTPVPSGVVARPLSPAAECTWALRLRPGWRADLSWLGQALGVPTADPLQA